MDAKKRKNLIRLVVVAVIVLLAAYVVTRDGLPRGNFRKVCSDLSLVDGKMTCQCQDGKGGVRAEKIYVDGCVQVDATSSGRLVCTQCKPGYELANGHCQKKD